MSKLKSWVGILILFTYLCPFVSCESLGSQVALPMPPDSIGTKTISDSIVKANLGDTAITLLDTAAVTNTLSKTETTITTALENELQPQDAKNKIWGRLFFPTDNSISGLGEVCSFDDNVSARFLLVSFMLSIVILLPLKLSDYKIGRALVVGVNLACVIVFMYFTAVVDRERLLWGVWLLLVLVSFQLFLEIKYKASATSKAGGNTTWS